MLDRELTLSTVGDARGRLMQAFDGAQLVEIDVSAVETCDLAGAQLLVAALKTAQQSGLRIAMAPGGNAALTRTLSRAGLTEAYEALVAACAADAEGAQ